MERLCAVGWAERGLSVTCGACGLPSFIPFSQAAGRAACPGCSGSAAYETGSSLTVYYRLSSHLDQLSDQGGLPHLLAIPALHHQGKQFHSLPGIDVWFSADESDLAEADIFGIRDGRILSGEVKTSASEFSPAQVSRDVGLSSRLEADTHILAATDEIPLEVAEMAQAAMSGQRADLAGPRKEGPPPVRLTSLSRARRSRPQWRSRPQLCDGNTKRCARSSVMRLSQGGSTGSNPVGLQKSVAGQGPDRYHGGQVFDHL